MDALQQRHYSQRAIAKTMRVSYGTILRCQHKLGMAVGEQFSWVSDVELDKFISNIFQIIPDAGKVMIMGVGGLHIHKDTWFVSQSSA